MVHEQLTVLLAKDNALAVLSPVSLFSSSVAKQLIWPQQVAGEPLLSV
jgi:hypothetical protein